MLSRFAPPLVLAVAPALSAQGTCLTQGLTIDVQGGRLGDFVTFHLQGAPSTSGFMGVDFGGGPVVTPLGTFCLDLSPKFFTKPISVSASGTRTLKVKAPPDPTLEGVEAFFQGFLADGTPPFGLAFSNGVSTTFYPPRVYFLEHGYSTPFGGNPATIVYHDGLTDVPAASFLLTHPASDALHLPALRCLAVLMENGTLLCMDDETGAVVSSTSISTAPSPAFSLQATDTPGVLLALHRGTPTTPGGGIPGAVSVIDTIAGTTNQIPLTEAQPDAMIAIPGTTLVYLRDGNDVVGVDHALGLEVSTAGLDDGHGDVVDWLLQGGTLLTLHEGSGAAEAVVQGIDVATGASAFGSSFPVQGAGSGLASQMRFGPALGQAAILVLFPAEAEITVVDPASLTVVATQFCTPGTTAMELSPGAMEWLLLQPGSDTPGPTPGSLSALNPDNLAVSPVATFPSVPQTTLTSLPSKKLRKAYVTSGSNSVFIFGTDPTVGPGLEIPIATADEVSQTATN